MTGAKEDHRELLKSSGIKKFLTAIPNTVNLAVR